MKVGQRKGLLEGMAWLLLSRIVFIPLSVIGGFYTAFSNIREAWYAIGTRMYKSAVSIDQYANIWVGDVLNKVMITEEGYQYGDEDDTISDITGRNERDGTLTKAGQRFTKILNILGKDHSLESIDE